MKLKNISRLLSVGVLLNSFNLASYASILSEDGRYETFSGNDITVNDILEEDKVDIKIEGNTLVNVMGKGFKETDKYSFLHGNNLIDDNSFVRFTMDSSDKRAFRKLEYTPLKPSTTYTLFVEIKENTIQGVSDNLHVLYPISNTSDSAFNDIWGISIPDATVGIHKKLVTTKSSFDGCTVGIRSYLRHLDGISGSLAYRLWMVEGDHMDEDIPYFEGIKSGFEDNLVTQEMVDSGEEKAENLGKYKVEVKSTGKNMLSGWVQGMIHGETGNLMTSVDFVSSDYVPVNPEKSYTYTGLAQAFYYYDSDYNYIGNTITNTLDDLSLNLTIPDMCSYVRLRYPLTSLESITGSKIDTLDEMLGYPNIFEEGSTATEYEPYKESINTFYLNSPLLEGDTIEIINGQTTHVHRTKKVILDGSEDESYTWYDSNVSTMIEWNTNDIYTPYGIMFCDRLPIVDYDRQVSINNTNVGVSSVHHKAIRIRVVVGNMTLNEFKEWFKNNPITLIYKISEPIYEPIKADLSVQLFKGTTHISNNSNIPTNMEITVDRTLNRAIEAIELAKINPTIDNLSKARMWTNLVKESLKKDELQEEINTITNIKGLGLEKKSVTANVDIYIKSENSLSMTLSTNSIMFEDYSGVSDIEKLNALEITVNSSLPYDLNAYLESEIQNSDKSTTLDSNLLQIKESSNLDYKTFNNTTDKVILKEDYPSGNYNKHNIDLKMEGTNAYKADIYKTVIKFEAEQK